MNWYGVDLEWAYADLLSGIRRRTGCNHRSQDVLHDSLIRLALANERGVIEEPQTYLRGIVRNALVDQFHEESRWLGFPEPEPREVAPSAESVLELKQRLMTVQQTLECLPARCRDIFWLFRVEGYSYREIAELRGLSLRVVEREIAKALLAVSATRDAESGLTRRRVLKGAALVALAVGLGEGSLYYTRRIQTLWSLRRRTSTGELGGETLPDGSSISLSASAEIAASFTRSERDVTLLRGEAVFDVKKDYARPFVVDSGGVRVTVLGTRFAVAKFSDRIRISVDHGRVEVEAGRFWNRQHLVLESGQVAEFDWSAAEAPQLRTVAVKAASAFTFANHFLSFDGAHLNEVAETLTRYRHGVVRVRGAESLTAGTITAGVPMRGIEGFIDLLPTIAPVDVKRRGEEVDLIPR